MMRKGFTLVEVVTTLAVLGLLATVTVIVLNPSELLKQGRDARRISDMSLLDKNLSYYYSDALNNPSTLFMGTSSVVYVSVPDPTATSTVGTDCTALGLPTLPSGYTYHCAPSSTYRNVNGTGWIPVNLSTMSTGASISTWPVDPTNQTSTRMYYTYTTDGTNYEVTANIESAKYDIGGSSDVISNDGGTFASVYQKGTSLTLEPLDYGDPSLVGYWPLNEGSGSTAYDYSGYNAMGTWNGTQTGSSTYYSMGMNGTWAGMFDGSTDYLTLATSTAFFNAFSSKAIAITAWFYPNADTYKSPLISVGNGSYNFFLPNYRLFSTSTWLSTAYWDNSKGWCGGSNTYLYATSTSWYFIAFVESGSAINFYHNAAQSDGPSCVTNSFVPSAPMRIGLANAGEYAQGMAQNIRIYNKALTAAQITALYNAKR